MTPIPTDDARSVTELARHLDGACEGCAEVIVHGLAALDDAQADDLTFIADAGHARRWPLSAARAVIVSESIEPVGFDSTTEALIRVPNAELAMIDVLELFASGAARPAIGVHPTAWVDPAASLGTDVRIGPHVSVGADAIVGDRVVLHAGVQVYDRCRIGDDSVLHGNTTLSECVRLGRRVLLHGNVSIGFDGFGYRPAADGSGLRKIPHLGSVVIEDDVEIGGGSNVDRGKFSATVIGRGTKIDSLVQIGHNCRIGKSCVIASGTGVAGSCQIDDDVQIGGCVAISDHIHIGAGARIAGYAGCIRDVPAGATHAGYPNRNMTSFFREQAALKRLPEVLRDLTRRSRGDIP